MLELRATTAIADANFESLVAKCLFDNGWNVEKRLLDARDINLQEDELLLISLDLEGLNQEILTSLLKSNSKLLLFGPNPQNFESQSAAIFEPVQSADQVLSLIRGNYRQPLLQRKSNAFAKRAQLHLFLSARPGVGGSVIAANSAMESSQRDKKVLLIDGDLSYPSLFHYLGVRKLEEPHAITPSLTVVEVGGLESDPIEPLERWMGEYDAIVIDGGSLARNSLVNGDKRRSGVLSTWCLDFAYKNYLVTTDREIDIHPFTLLKESVSRFKPQSTFLTIKNMVERVPKNSASMYAFPRDPRSLQKCEKEKLLLSEGAPRSPLSKAIAQFVAEAML